MYVACRPRPARSGARDQEVILHGTHNRRGFRRGRVSPFLNPLDRGNPQAQHCQPTVPDEATLLDIYHAQVRQLYRLISRRVGGDRDLAEDVTQETWLRALASWRRRGVPRDPLAWLVAVAGNLLRNHFRRRRPEALTMGFDVQDEALELENPEQAALVQWALTRLRDGQARLIEAYHLDGQRVADIASRFGLSERAVEGRLRRGRQTLRSVLEPYVQGKGERA